MGRRNVRVSSRARGRGPVVRRARQRGVRAARGGRRSRVHLGRRSCAPHSVARHGHLRDARARILENASRHPRASAWDVRSADNRARDRAPQEARRHRRGADAGASPRARSPSRAARPDELLGLQQLRLLRARTAVCRVAHAGRRGPRIQAHGARAARRWTRSHPRCRLQ